MHISKQLDGGRISDRMWQKLRRRPQSSSLTPAIFPNEWQCIVHLKLLNAFIRLRNDVVDDLIQQSVLDSLLPDSTIQDRVLSEDNIRNQVWQMYLEQAFERFEIWWRTLVSKNQDGSLKQIDCWVCLEPGKLESLIQNIEPMTWSEKNLPPLDVIMVLHSFILSPRCFLEDCIRFDMLPLWKAGIPWKFLDAAINVSGNEYMTSTSAQKRWTKTTGLPWDIRQARLEESISCPHCEATIKYKYTVTTPSKDNSHPKLNTVIQCRACNTKYNNDSLQVHKFRQSIMNLRQANIPLPGTILEIDGLAKSVNEQENNCNIFELNRLMQGTLGLEILNLTKPNDKGQIPTQHNLQSLKLFISDTQQITESPHLQTALHRTFQHHSDSHAIFSLDLAAAVVRQYTFITKMSEIDWLHSPALESTMTDLLTRYEVFFDIMGENKNQVAVPTYAIDLAWHTHQLSPAAFYAYSISKADNVFVIHDDRIDESVRTDAFEWTGRQYEMLTGGKDYHQCLCWYCATALEVVGGDTEMKLVFDDGGHVRLNPETEKTVLTRIAECQYKKLEEDYGVACNHARKHCRLQPDRETFLKSYKWLYPRAVPAIGV